MKLHCSRKSGFALRGAFAALLLALGQTAAAQAPWDAAPEGDDPVASAMFDALVRVFQQELSPQAPQGPFAQGNAVPTEPRVPSSLSVEQVGGAVSGPALLRPSGEPANPGSLQAPGVQPGANADPAGLTPAQTSADCVGTSSSAECLLAPQPGAEARKPPGGDFDTVGGVPMIPGVTLNPRPR